MLIVGLSEFIILVKLHCEGFATNEATLFSLVNKLVFMNFYLKIYTIFFTYNFSKENHGMHDFVSVEKQVYNQV